MKKKGKKRRKRKMTVVRKDKMQRVALNKA